MRGARPTVWREALVFGGRHSPQILATGAVLAVTGALAYKRLAPVSPLLAGVVVGVLGTMFVWAVVWLMWVSSGLSQRLQGALADEWTATALHRLRLRGNWHQVLAVRAGDEHVDIVLTCPAGVVAIDAKWSVQPWVSDDVSRAAERAAIAAGEIERQLQAVGMQAPVSAAIVVWGPASSGLARRQVPMGRHLVDLVPARELKAWSRAQRRGLLEREESARLAKVFSDRVAEQAAAEAAERARIRPGVLLRWLTRPR